MSHECELRLVAGRHARHEAGAQEGRACDVQSRALLAHKSSSRTACILHLYTLPCLEDLAWQEVLALSGQADIQVLLKGLSIDESYCKTYPPLHQSWYSGLLFVGPTCIECSIR